MPDDRGPFDDYYWDRRSAKIDPPDETDDKEEYFTAFSDVTTEYDDVTDQSAIDTPIYEDWD